ncbi:MAG: tetratricopeptide (TPR) repeat protein, partial [Granulosicoccus sp.]
MKKKTIAGGLLSGVLLFGGLSSAQEVEGPNDKAKRYHALLLKRPGNPTVFSRFVDAWLDTGNKKNLKGWLEQAAKEGGVPEWRVLAALHEYLGEDEAALGALNEAVKRDEKDASLRLARAKLQAKLLSFEAALQDLEAATADEKLGVEASKLQGIYLARAGRIDEAVKIWKEVIEKFPKDEELREDLIEVELVEGLYDDAIAASQELVKLTKDPYKKALRQLRLGDIQILGNKKEEGLKTYEEIMAATGADTWLEREVLAQVERVFMREDDIQGLRDFFQKLRETYPRRVSVRKALARQMALNGEMDEAIALFREVIKITPGDLGNREEFISFLETNERWKDAREELNNLIKQRDQDPLLWERLAGIEEKLKDTEGLKAALA